MKRILVFSSIILLTASLIGIMVWRQKNIISQIKVSYIKEQNDEIDRVVSDIETTFNTFYQGIRTISLLPGVRMIDRYGNNINPDSKAAMQQIYNNTYLNVKLSEIYVLPSVFNPDRIDPKTNKPELPILTFDEFITDKERNKKGSEDKDKLEEEEIYEYRLMQEQLQYLGSQYPTNANIKGLNIPAVSGKEVITCDNSEFTEKDKNSNNNAPRNGIALTVPLFDMEGKFHGGVSGVMRTNILKKVFPNNDYGLINQSNSWELIENPSEEWISSKPYFEKSQQNPNLIISSVRNLKIEDSTPWQLWVTKKDDVFYQRGDVRQAYRVMIGGIIVSLILGCILFYSALSALNKQAYLEAMVAEKTGALSARNKEMELILNNSEEGFITINLDGTMDEEHSLIVESWFGKFTANNKFWDYIANKSTSRSTLFRIGWEQIVEEIFPFDLSADQMPNHIKVNDKHLSIKFKPVNDPSGHLFKVLLMIMDITPLIESSEREIKQRELLAIFQNFNTDKNGLEQFHDDALSIVNRIVDRPSLTKSELDFRDIHTLKGNASQFGLLTMVEFCHKLETELSDSRRPMTDNERAQLKAMWEQSANRLKDFVTSAKEKHVVVDFKEYDRILTQMKSNHVASAVVEQFESLSKESTTVPFRRLAEQIKSLASRLNRGTIVVKIQDNGVRLDKEKFREVWINSTHLIRNAVDHAFEGHDITQKTITLESLETPDEIQLRFVDNGKGVDWNKLKEVAIKNNLAHQSEEDLKNALFADGVSTKSSVSDISGRGVGMASLKAAIQSIGGQIVIISKPLHGTEFLLRFSKKENQRTEVA